MARLPNLTREQLKPEDQKFYDAISDSRAGVRGPFGQVLAAFAVDLPAGAKPEIPE